MINYWRCFSGSGKSVRKLWRKITKLVASWKLKRKGGLKTSTNTNTQSKQKAQKYAKHI